MSRAVSFKLEPQGLINHGATTEVYTYAPDGETYTSMTESVYLDLSCGRFTAGADLTPEDARALAKHLIAVAEIAEAHQAQRHAHEELQASYDEICDQIRDAEELGGTGCFYAHPWIHYVPAEQLADKVKELNDAGVKQFMVLAEPTFEGEPA